MLESDQRVTAAIAARGDGRHAAALALLQSLFADAKVPISLLAPQEFITLFEWSCLLAEYPPAADALRMERDEQVAHVLRGDLHFGPPRAAFSDGTVMHAWRFSVIVKMNSMLGDTASTSDLFVRLEQDDPGLARRYAHLALPALVATARFGLAERYRGDALARLPEFNQNARTLPLFAPGRTAPRLAAELMGLVAGVHIGMAVLTGLGRAGEAQALRVALLTGLAPADARALAERDLDAPGAISRELVAHQMAQEPAERPAD